MIMSTSSALAPAAAKARSQALMPRSEVNSPSAAMWRCLMPVRWAIQPSEGIKLLSQLSVGNDVFWKVGAATLCLCAHHRQPAAICASGVSRCSVAIPASIFSMIPCWYMSTATPMALGESQRVGAAVALHGDAVQAQEHGTVVAPRVDPDAKLLDGRARQ